MRFNKGELSEIEIPNVWREKLGDKEQNTRSYQNAAVTSVTEVLIPTDSGPLVIPERSLTASIFVRPKRRNMFPFGSNDPFSDDNFGIFRRFNRTINRRFVAPPLEVNVKSLPQPPIAHKGYIPVGTLKVSSEIDSDSLNDGDNATIKVTLEGTANLRPIKLPKPENSHRFKIYEDKANITTEVRGNKVYYTKTFILAAVPLSSGELELPIYSFIYFDPLNEEYRFAKTSRESIDAKTSSTNNQLEVSGNLNQKIDPKNVKNDIVRIGEDLLPQHEGSSAFSTARNIPSRVFYSLIVFIPFLSFALKKYFNRGKDNKSLLRRKNALTLALSRLDQPCSPAELRSCIVDFLSDLLDTQTNSLSDKELIELVNNKFSDSTIADELNKTLSSLQGALYSGNADTKIDNNFSSNCGSLLTLMDKNYD